MAKKKYPEKWDIGDQTMEGVQAGETLHVLLWGPPKSGKTVLAHTFPRTRTLDFDNGMQSVLWALKKGIIQKDPSEIIYRTIMESGAERALRERPSGLDRATDTLDEWREERDEWDTLVVDSATEVSQCCIAKALYELGRQRPSYSDTYKDAKKMGFRVMSRQDWGPAMSLFEGFMEQLRTLCQDKNLILVCHEYEETTDSGIVIAKYPLLIGQLRQRVSKSFDEVWYMTMEDDEHGIQTVQSKKVKAGSRLGDLPDFMPNPTYEKIMEAIRGAQ